MILIRYLIKEALKIQFVIFSILFLLFFSQKIINILNIIAYGNISQNLFFLLLFLNFPEIIKLILPLSLALGLFLSYEKHYIQNEITIIYASGLGKQILLKITLIVIFINIVISLVNIGWISPIAIKNQENLLNNSKNISILNSIFEKKINVIKDQNIVLYVKKIKKNKFDSVFISELNSINSKNSFIIIAKKGKLLSNKDKNYTLILKNGTFYKGFLTIKNFYITKFKKLRIIINYKNIFNKKNNIKTKNLLSLFKSKKINFKIELHWRLTLIISILIMGLIVTPLNEIKFLKKTFKIFFITLTYLFFFLLQNSVYSNVKEKENNLIFKFWFINFIFLFFSIILNLLNNIKINKIYIKFFKKNV